MASFLVNKTKNRRFMFSITVTQVCSEELSFLLATASFFLVVDLYVFIIWSKVNLCF